MALSFDGKTAVITGAGRGLGRAYALELARRGANVVVNDYGGGVHGDGASSEAADAVVAEIEAAGGRAIADAGSVTDPDAVAALIEQTQSAFGRIDVLINNAGVLRDKSFHKMAFEDFEFVIDVHLMGTARVTHAAWPIMREQGYGRVVFTTSGSGVFGNFGQANYAAAKAGLIGLQNALRLEGEKYDVRVNTILPTAATRMSEGLFPADAAERLAPEFVAAGVVYLCSDDAPTGAVLSAGGGLYALAATVEAEGVVLSNHEATPEAIAASWAKITDLNAFHRPANVLEQALRIFKDDQA